MSFEDVVELYKGKLMQSTVTVTVIVPFRLAPLLTISLFYRREKMPADMPIRVVFMVV